MSLVPIARSLGGDVYDHGRRANVPGPGHSAHDRSVSLLLQEGRVVVHSFGRSTWLEVLDDLRQRGLIACAGRPASSFPCFDVSPPSRAAASDRVGVARRLWESAAPLSRQLSLFHLRRRAIAPPASVSEALRQHPGAPSAIYAEVYGGPHSWRGSWTRTGTCARSS